MPSIIDVAPAALAAALFCTWLGWRLAQRLMPAGLAAAAAPALGWAVFSAAALPILSSIGFTRLSVLALTAAAAVSPLLWRRGLPASVMERLPAWAWGLAGLLGTLPALALMPKFADGGVLLGPPLFDHAKVAIIDQITRQGLPPGNPFFATAGSASQLSYYYLWHFSAAILAEALGVSGWAADIAMDWFTAFASALLMMGIAVHIAGRRSAAWLVALLCIPGSIRPVLDWVFGQGAVSARFPRHADIGAWVNQASWVPQHLASGCCVVLSALLMVRLTMRGLTAVPVLGLVVAAGFESSSWVGGVAFAVAALMTAPALLLTLPADARWRFVGRAAIAAVIAGAIVLPFAISQLHSVAARGAGFPVALIPYEALGGGSGLADLAAFWVLVVPFNLPALFPLGGLGLIQAWRMSDADRTLVLVLACFAFACLGVTWLLKSTIENNDLGWRAAIPAILLLAPFAAGAWSRWLTEKWRLAASAACLLAALGLPQAIEKFGEAVHGQRPADAAGFAGSTALWAAVRQQSAAGERVGNNPLMLANLTPWPDNIAWALLSNRPSCYAGWGTAIAYAGVSRDELFRIETLFRRVFAGRPEAGDVDALAQRFDCRIVVVTPQDSAWSSDPFATASAYRLVDLHAQAWRIYRRR